MLVAGAALDEQHAPGPGGRGHEHAAGVVPGHPLARVEGDLDRVQGRALPLGRHRDDRAGDGPVRGRVHGHHPDQAAVLEHPDIERLAVEAVGDGGEREVDRRPRRRRPARAHVEDLAVAAGLAGADAHREDRRPGGRVGEADSGVGTVGHEHYGGQFPPGIVLFGFGDGARQIAPAGLGPHVREIKGIEPFADPPQIDAHVVGEGRHHVVPDRRHRRIETALAARVGDAHAARPVEQDRDRRAVRGRRLLAHGAGEQDENHEEDGEP